MDNIVRDKRRNYKSYIKKDQYVSGLGKYVKKYKLGHLKQNQQGKNYKKMVDEVFSSEVVQSMKQYSHHGHTTLFGHSMHVSYYNYLLCKKLGLDARAGARAGLMHDLFLYDWHEYDVKDGERLHGFEHPTKALKNAGKYFDISRKEGDIIAKHMFPLTITPPRYKESLVIIGTDKFCSICEVMDGYVQRIFCGAKDTRKKWYGSNKGELKSK